MPTSPSPRRRLVARLLLWLPLFAIALAFLAIGGAVRPATAAGSDLWLKKRIAGTAGQPSPFPMPTGQTFTYELHYGWNSPVPNNRLSIVDTLPAGVEVVSPPGPAVPNTPFPSTFTTSQVAGVETVTFRIDTSGSVSSGSGVVTIPVRLVPGASCTSTSVLCNSQATIAVEGDPTTTTAMAPPDGDFPAPCVFPQASDTWKTSFTHHHGCACGQPVMFDLALESPPGGFVGGLDMIGPTLHLAIPNANGATFTGIVTVTDFPGNLGWSPAGVVPSTLVAGAGTSSLAVDLSSVTLDVRDPSWTYHVYVEVVFPCPAYATGSGRVDLTLDYRTPCGDAPRRVLSATYDACAPTTKASVSKSLAFSGEPEIPASVVPPSLCPGCCAWYRVYYGNSGTLPILNPSFEDVLPPGFDVAEVRTELSAPFTGVKVTATDSSGGAVPNWGPRSISTPGWDVATVAASSGTRVAKVAWAYTGSLPTGQSIVAWIRVCNVDAPEGTAHNTVRGAHAPNDFTLPTPVGPCGPRLFLRKDYVGGHCGDTAWTQAVPAGAKVRFRLTVANVGTSAASNVVVKDLLPPGITYVPNADTFAFRVVSHLGNGQHSSADCAHFHSTPPFPISPAVASTTSPQTVTWTVASLPGRCDGVLEGLQIEFDAIVDPTAQPGTYVNRFETTLDGVTSVSNDAPVEVNGVPQWRVEKWVRLVGGTTWSKSVAASPGTDVEFLLEVHNASNVAVSDPCLVDVMPSFQPGGDAHVLPTPMSGSAFLTRGSTFDLPVKPGTVLVGHVYSGSATSALSSTVPTPIVTSWFLPVAGSRNPDRSGSCLGTCGGQTVVNPAGATSGSWTGSGPAPTGAFAFQVRASGLSLAPGASFAVIVPATVPYGVSGRACNNVAASVTSGGSCARAQTLDPVCVLVAPPPACLELLTKGVECDPRGGFRWTFEVKNLTGVTVNQVNFPTTGPLTFTPSTLSVGQVPPNGTATGTVTISGAGATQGTTVCFPVSLAIGGPAGSRVICTNERVCVGLPRCVGSGCDDPRCRVPSVSINTGMGSVGAGDPNWTLIGAPAAPPNYTLNVGGPAWIIPQIVSWDVLPGSQWISAYATPFLNQNNSGSGDTPYTFQRAFCVCEGVRELVIDLDIHNDNLVGIFHVAPDGTRTSIANLTNATTQAFINPASHVNYVIPNPAAGRHHLEVELRNDSSVAMGFNLAGTVTASPAGAPLMVSDACCSPEGRIVGRKYDDLGCDGVVDADDPGLAGFQFTATDGTNTYVSNVSDSTGAFFFPPLPAGTYTISENPNGSWIQTAPSANGTRTVIVTTGGIAQVFFANCDPCETLLTGAPRDGCCGYVAKLAPAGGWSVHSVAWTVSGGTMTSVDVTSPFTTSPSLPSSSGTTTLTPPPGGPVVLTLNAENTEGGCEVCVDLVITISRPVKKGHETTIETRVCGTKRVCFPCCRRSESSSKGALCVFKYEDSKPFGDATGDPGVAGVTFTVKDASGTVVGTGVTNASGHLCFSLPYGSYSVAETVPSGQVATGPNPRTVVVTAGPPVVVEFGNRRVEDRLFDLEVRKTMEPNPLVRGGSATATITVVNAGPGTCPGPVVLTDAWTPTGALLLGSSSTSATGWTRSGSTWGHPGPIPAGYTATFTYAFTVARDAEKAIRNCARIEAKGDSNPKNNEACVSIEVVDRPPGGSDLVIRKTMKRLDRPPGAWVATITLVNTGPNPCPAPIVVKDVLTPIGAMTPVSGLAIPSSSWAYANGTFTYTGSTLAVNAPQTFTITFLPGPVAHGVVTNCATVEAERDTNPRNNRSCVEVELGGGGAPFDLVVRKTMDPRTLVPGQTATATITVVNAGPGPCPAPIVLTDAWQPTTALSLTGVVASHPGNWSIHPTTGAATFTGTSLPANQPQTFTYTFLVARDAQGVVTNCASVEARGDADPKSNRSCVERPVRGDGGGGDRGDLQLRKTMTPNPLVPGGTATATITLVNAGPGPCAGPIVVTDVFAPTGPLSLLGIVASDPTRWTVNVGTGACTYTGSALPVGVPQTFTYTFRVSPRAEGEVRNCAQVRAPNDPNPANNESCVVVPLRRKGGERPGATPTPGDGAPPGRDPQPAPPRDPVSPAPPAPPRRARYVATFDRGEPIEGTLGSLVLVGEDGVSVDLATQASVVRIGKLELATEQIAGVRFTEANGGLVATVLTRDGRAVPFPVTGLDGRSARLRSVSVRPAGGVRGGFEWSSSVTKPPRMSRPPREITVHSVPK